MLGQIKIILCKTRKVILKLDTHLMNIPGIKIVGDKIKIIANFANLFEHVASSCFKWQRANIKNYHQFEKDSQNT